MPTLVEEFADALLAMDRVAAGRLLERAAPPTGNPLGLLEPVVTGALEAIGDRWERGEASLAQVYLTAKMCEDLLHPYLPEGQSAAVDHDTVLLVLEDHHLLGASTLR